jgi:uncharacterized protein YkvS
MPGTIIAASVFGLTAGTFAYAATAFAINMVASAIVSKAFAPKGYGNTDQTPNPGNNQQLPPAGDNKLPIIYGTAYTGGMVTDLSITQNNQRIYYVLALSEVTNTEYGETADTITFGNVYWGGKKCVFDPTDQYKVIGLLDESTGITDATVAGKMNIYLYRNGSNQPVNTTMSAITVMSASDLVYKWDSTKLMTNCAFAIVELTYSVSANINGLQQTRFQVTNSRYRPGDCFLDFMQSARYGAALPLSQINTSTLNALNAYSDQSFPYTTFAGTSTTQTRFRFDGLIDTNNTVMTNLQTMASCCDCLIKYNEIVGQWGVIVQQPSYTVVADINDSNMVSGIQITPIDLSASYNIVEVKFPDGSSKDSFNSATFDLAQVNPGLLYPNEPINKQTISLPLVNNNVRAQYIANRFLEQAREDLQFKVDVNFSGLQFEAGDVVTVTNANYGWTAKLFRVAQVVEKFSDDGSVVVSLTLMEYNPSVFDDMSIIQFTPAPNTGIGSPLGFGTLFAPTITNIQANAPIPSFDVAVTASSAGIVQYAEVYYSAFATPTDSQRIFAGTTIVNPGGNPYNPGASMGNVTLSDIPQGDWYFSVRMVNALGTSLFSASSTVFAWRPLTFQYSRRYLAVAYADNATGTTGFNFNPRNKAFYGLYNTDSANTTTTASLYTWYPAPVNFGADNYVLWSTRSNRRASFGVGNASFANLTGAFVPTETSIYDTSIWSGLVDGNNIIDLDARTGQLTRVGTTSVSSADGLLSVTNNTNGSMVVSLERFLNFGGGVYSKTFNAATLTVDIYGRVVGFTQPDEFYYTENVVSATAGQTTFAITHVVGNILVFRNGLIASTSEYTETTSNITFSNACAAGEIITLINMRAVSTDVYYEFMSTEVASMSGANVVYTVPPYQLFSVGDKVTFSNTGTPTQYTVQSVNTSTKTVTFTTTVTGVVAGDDFYRYRAAGAAYRPFSRVEVDLSSVSTYTPTQMAPTNGFECFYVNGVQINEIDYDLTGPIIGGFPAPVTGRFIFIQYSMNNFGVPASNVTNTVAYSVSGALSYVFPNNPLAMAVYANGALLANGSSYDFTATTAGYNLTNAINNNFTLFNQQTFARDGAA